MSCVLRYVHTIVDRSRSTGTSGTDKKYVNSKASGGGKSFGVDNSGHVSGDVDGQWCRVVDAALQLKLILQSKEFVVFLRFHRAIV